MRELDMFSLFRRWRLTVTACVLVGAIAGLLVATLQPKTYSASAELYVYTPNHSDYQTLLGDEETAKALADFAGSDAVLNASLAIVKESGLSLTRFRQLVSTTNIRSTQYVTITVHDRSATRAALLASEVARQASYRFTGLGTDTGTRSFLQSQMQRLEEQIVSLQNRVDSRSTSIASAAGAARTLAADRSQYGQLVTTYNAMAGPQIAITQFPSVAKRPAGVSKTIGVVMGALAGLFVSVLGLLLLDRRRTSTVGDDSWPGIPVMRMERSEESRADVP
jgi:uncharacterized protein involved in exopolysaccharide biosynthesis